MGLRVVVDTNVFVSILQFGGRVSEILDLALQGTVELVTSQVLKSNLVSKSARRSGGKGIPGVSGFR
jgi:predicted nucleic acid-binding protein